LHRSVAGADRVTDRLSSLDVSFLYLEGRTTPMHVGGLLVFQPPDQPESEQLRGEPDGRSAVFDYERLVELIEQRIALVPRYRQKIRTVPGHLANPVWVDDPEFDISFHVRRSALPKPGSDQQLREFCARIQSRPLDRHRPLWEIYLVEGLRDNRIAIITKTHHAMVDGVSAIEIGQVILDASGQARQMPDDLWMPEPEPSSLNLLSDAVCHLVRRPSALLDTLRLGANDFRATTGQVLRVVGGLASAARLAIRAAPDSPLNAQIGQQRRYGTAITSLSDYKRVRGQQSDTGTRTTINDVVLATVAGALRGWLLFRGESVTPSTTVRAMVPVSVRSDSEIGALGNRISAVLVDLPVGEPNPVLRLAQISYAMRAHKESGQSVGADALVALSGFAPPTLHALGARAANGLTRRLFNLVVTNVPGPQYPLYAAGARLLEIYPVVPLAEGQAVSIGLTSYNGGVYYGLNADRDAMPDVDVLAALIEESLAELLAASDTMAAHRENGSASVSPVVPGSHRVAASMRRSAGATGPGVTSETESTQHEAPQPGTPPLDVSSEASQPAAPDELAPPSTASTRGKVVLSRSPSTGGGARPVHGDGAGAQSARSSRGKATAGAARKRSGNRQSGGSSGTAAAADRSTDLGTAAERPNDPDTAADRATSAGTASDDAVTAGSAGDHVASAGTTANHAASADTTSDHAGSADTTSDCSTKASDLSAKDDA
jgi:diacylglycerol O-acyltransferase / wax synthase